MECFRRTYIGDKAVGKSLVFKRLNDAVGLPTQMDVLDVLVQKLYERRSMEGVLLLMRR